MCTYSFILTKELTRICMISHMLSSVPLSFDLYALQIYIYISILVNRIELYTEVHCRLKACRHLALYSR